MVSVWSLVFAAAAALSSPQTMVVPGGHIYGEMTSLSVCFFHSFNSTFIQHQHSQHKVPSTKFESPCTQKLREREGEIEAANRKQVQLAN